MNRWPVVPIALALVLGACTAEAQWSEAGGSGSLVGISVEVEGRTTPLYSAPDGSGRFYLEAREGCSYAVALSNRTAERLGVVLTVDGLNAISGQRDPGVGRMYVLGPWEQTTVRGWRSSLADVRRFTFVDERASYAARSGQANGKMGWIEAAVYRERRAYVSRPWLEGRPPVAPRSEERDRADASRPLPSPMPAPSFDDGEAEAPAARADAAPAERSKGYGGARSYPGTGWGASTEDHAVVVTFEAESAAADRVVLRYEYRSALVALGILPRPSYGRDRLRERERGDLGFAKPPAW